MSKHLRIWLFALLGMLLASTTLLAQGVITMTASKAVGETVKLRIEANGNVTIEGVKELPQLGKDKKNYTLTSQTITIHGDVTKLDCSDNQLTSLDLPKNTALTTLYCDRNQLTRLDVSKNAALTELDCSDNQLTSLDLPKSTVLTELFCFENKLTSLDVSKNIALTELYCSNNQLTSLNVSRCARLNTLYCDSNRINGKAMNKLENSLPNRRRKSSGAILLVDNSPEKRDKNRCSPADVTISEKKNWSVL